MPGWLTERDQGLLDAALVRLIDVEVGPWAALLGLLVAGAVGAVHALGPGHGKALIGAYLASSHGRARDAVALGGIVAAMHTGSVLVLGVGFFLTQRMLGGPQLTPWLTLVSAAAVVAVGIHLVVRQVRANHHHDGHDHHDLPAGVPPLSRGGVLALASAGGLLPSPAALLVLATALAVGRSGYGLALVAAFSLGLAATLTGIGLLVLWGRGLLARHGRRRHRLQRVVRLVPLVAAAAVALGGLVIGADAVLTLVGS